MSKIEEVAKAIWAATEAERWENVPPIGRRIAYEEARAAIEAMKVPTDTMLALAVGYTDFVLPEAIGSTPAHYMGEMRTAWSVMIDAALSEDQP